MMRISKKVYEEVAASVHDAWVKEKLKEGWKSSDHRDLKKKLDNRLVPYDELSEDDKKYDRITAQATVKALKKAGYIITKDGQTV